MLEIEEVVINTGYDEAEYLGDECDEQLIEAPADNIELKVNLPSGIIVRKSTPTASAGSSASPIAISGSNGEPVVPVKRKTPIIRKAGEVVTPIFKTSGTVTVSPSTGTIRPKVEWAKVAPPGLKAPLSLTTYTITSVGSKVEQHLEANETDDSQQDDALQDLNDLPEHQQYGNMEEASGSVDLVSLNDKLSRIEHLLEKVVAKQGQHDSALKALKFNIKDLRIELKSSNKQCRTENYDFKPVPVKRERKRLVVFPIADDNYLLRLEDLIQADEEIRSDLSGLFGEAPASSVYEFMRKNCHSLFEHTSKYTWTGKSVHNVPCAPASNPAHKMAIVELLISCGCDKFQYITRDTIEKEFRRALTNFNESRVVRLKRRMEKSGANESLEEIGRIE